MKKNRFLKRALALLLAITMLVSALIAVPTIAQGASAGPSVEGQTFSFWADPENTLTQEDVTAFIGGNKTTMNGAVGCYRRSTSGNYYLFLPSNADCTSLRVWFDTNVSTDVTVNGTAVTNGETTDVFSAINEGGVQQTYTIRYGNAGTYTVTAMKSGKVGTMYIDTTSGSMSSVNSSKSNYSDGTVMVVDEKGRVSYDGYMEKIQGRGNGTWTNNALKNPYNVKLGTSAKLLGMGKAKKWCLLANNEDDTLVKNQLTYDFADYIGVKYQPHCKPVDVYINQQYYGSYMLAEKVEIKSSRVNVTDAYENLQIANGTVDEATGVVVPATLKGSPIASTVSKTNSQEVGKKHYSTNMPGSGSSSGSGSGSTGGLGSLIPGIGGGGSTGGSSGPALVNPNDITGGYIYELEISERWISENAGFCGYNRQCWVMKSCDAATKEMVDYSYDLLYALGGSVYNNGVVPSSQVTTSTSSNRYKRSTTNPAPATKYQNKRWSEILDAESAVKYYWTQELFKNMDSSTSSTYFYKDSDSVDPMLYAGPMWDMDNSIGFDRSSDSRWDHCWTSYDDWYTKNARIYRFYNSDKTKTYSTNAQSPLNFYGALATNCSDFRAMAGSFWYNTVAPAIDILLGNAEDPNGVLHSTEYYINTVSLSNTMDNVRNEKNSSNPWNYSTQISGMNTWFSNRRSWLNDNIPKVNISNTTINIPSSECTGNEIRPDMTITYNGATLKEGVDYQVEYSNNFGASRNASATITGLGLYTGSVNRTFTITSGSIVGGSAELVENAYAGDTLEVVVKNSAGVVIPQYLTYQWKVNGVNVNGATDSTFEIGNEHKGSRISVSVNGDGTNIATAGITSNECLVSTSERPTGYAKTIASWNYDYSQAPEALVTADETGETYYYTATSGENAEISNLTASVNATTTGRIKWSGTADLYANTSTSVTPDQSPVMKTSKVDGISWGQFPYFETTTSTVGYESLTFSAKLGGTKKGPRDWKLQYSTDGVNYVDVEGTDFTITGNKVMSQAFEEVELPAECNNQESLRIRIAVRQNIAINNLDAIVGSTSGDASVNNIEIRGVSTDVISRLNAPEITSTSIQSDGTKLFSTDKLVITDKNGGADVFYTINGGDPILYQNAINPFNSTTAVEGDTAVVRAWANFGDINSAVTEFTAEFGGVNINQFIYDGYPKSVSNGVVFSNGGVYDESAKMYAYTDGNNQYVPLWNESNGAFCIAPDDGALWSATSGFYFEVSTAGFKDINFTCQGYTTASGPNSATLQYSLDGSAWVTVKQNHKLNASGALEQVFLTQDLPLACENKSKLYIRLITTENLTAGGEDVSQTNLHNNASKGNFYINNVVISGADNGETKMPYTNKNTSYFSSKAIKYYSPSGTAMQCQVKDEGGEVVLAGAYPEGGLVLTDLPGFNASQAGDYTVAVWAGDDDNRSLANIRHYYFKGETITKFNYNDSSKLLASYLDSSTVARNTSGTRAGTLSMYPDAVNPATLSYTNTYGVKVSKPTTAPFSATKHLDNPRNNGYWLIETSTLGYTNLTFNAEQLSSNKGPRDWGLAYSLDGNNYTYVNLSNVRAISNDASTSPVETYNNIALPEALNNQEKIYLKIFINGGECVNGKELELADSGNTGINGIELSGVALPVSRSVTIKALVAENSSCSTANEISTPATITVNGESYTAQNGEVELELIDGNRYTITATVNGSFVNSKRVTCNADTIIIPVVDVDVNADGVINGKDYAIIRKSNNSAKQSRWQNFVNIKETNFNY